ncbi:AVT2 [Symbiodinium natans]|uniref:AVT2 protein n=1 Tax=Symbiodinium natans TaxID=878477 RepID=A0A812PUD2_9DINO|nr:AVT2 [Symbiodinium natans]
MAEVEPPSCDVVDSEALEAPQAAHASEDGASKAVKQEIESSFSTSLLNLCKNIIGAGLLTLPVAVRDAGMIPYLVSITLLGVLNAFTFFLLGWCSAVVGASTFAELCVKSFSPRVAWVANLAVLLDNSMCCLANCVLIGDFFSKALSGLLPSCVILHGRAENLCIIGALLLVPLSLVTNLALLRYASLAGLGATAYVFALLLKDFVTLSDWSTSGPLLNNVTPLRPDFFKTMALLGSAFMAHYNAPKYYAQLQDRSVQKFKMLVCLAYGLAWLVFTAFGIFGFALFGFAAEGNVLKNYSFTPEVLVAWLSMGLSVVCTYPLVFGSFRDSSGLLLRKFFDVSLASIQFRLVFTCLGVAFTVLGGVAFSDVALVNELRGAILSPCLAFIYPAAMLLRTRSKRIDGTALPSLPSHTLSLCLWRLCCYSLLAFGIVFGAMALLVMFMSKTDFSVLTAAYPSHRTGSWCYACT